MTSRLLRRLSLPAVGIAALVLLALGLAGCHRKQAGGIQRWDTPVYYGPVYSVGLGTPPHAPWGTHVRVVQPAEPLPAEAWRTGGIVHRYGAAEPQVVVFGSSHALMYAHTIDGLCRDMKLSVAFIAADGVPAFFGLVPVGVPPDQWNTKEYDAARRQWLRAWHPEALFAIDRWDVNAVSGPVFAGRLHEFLQEVAPLAGQVVFVTEMPTGSRGASPNLWTLLKTQGAGDATLPHIRPDADEPLRQAIVAAALAAKADFPNLRVLRADRLFYESDGSIRYALGREYFYVDNDHLSEAGAGQARALFAEAIAVAHAARAHAGGAERRPN